MTIALLTTAIPFKLTFGRMRRTIGHTKHGMEIMPARGLWSSESASGIPPKPESSLEGANDWYGSTEDEKSSTECM